MYFWTWDTEEVLDMIRWMRAFNASGKGRVQFTGFDMQTPTVAMEIVRAFVTRYDPPYMTAIVRANDEIRAMGAPSSFGVATSTFPVAAICRQTRPLQRLHQDDRRHAWICWALVARGW